MEILFTKVMDMVSLVATSAKKVISDVKVKMINIAKDAEPAARAIYALVLDFINGSKAKYTYAFLIGFFFSTVCGCGIVVVAIFARKVAELFFALPETDYKMAVAVLLGAFLGF